MGKFLAILGGLAAMVGGVYIAIWVWRPAFASLVKGSIPPVLFFAGLIALIAGISSIKDAARTKKLEDEAKDEKAEPKS
jgi:Na+/H+-dicarboxylate symporter